MHCSLILKLWARGWTRNEHTWLTDMWIVWLSEIWQSLVKVLRLFTLLFSCCIMASPSSKGYICQYKDQVYNNLILNEGLKNQWDTFFIFYIIALSCSITKHVQIIVFLTTVCTLNVWNEKFYTALHQFNGSKCHWLVIINLFFSPLHPKLSDRRLYRSDFCSFFLF